MKHRSVREEEPLMSRRTRWEMGLVALLLVRLMAALCSVG
jgi:hypothetical protein